MRRPSRLIPLLLFAVLSFSRREARAAQPPVQDLKSLSIEELMQVDVMLVSRQPEPLAQTEAAISVITADDIRRSGVTTLADALGLAEGVFVARQNNGSWSVTARGFDTSANKMLVMVDRRTEFSPFFAGVFWNMLDYPLEDIERIEVIRGPSATLWGSNAVNGVINIITRPSQDTHGLAASVGGGPEDPGLADVRWGGGSGNVNYRVYGKFAARAAQVFPSGASSGDPRQRELVGFRADGGGTDGNQWLLKGDAFQSQDAFPDCPDGEFRELALQGRYSFTLKDASRLDVRGYYRREYRRVPRQFTYSLDTLDLDVQDAMTRGRHAIVWGGGYRFNTDRTEAGPLVSFDPARRSYPVSNLFIQDDIVIKADRVLLSPGVKVEHNALSGFELQANVRLRVQPAPRHTIWAAVSRATRRPTRLDADIRSLGPTGALLLAGGGDAFTSEKLVAGELGYRVQPAARLSMDATVFTHAYDDLRSQELPATGPPIVTANTLNGRSNGVELGALAQLAPWWRARVFYTFLDVTITRDAGSLDIGGGSSESNDPRHQFGLWHQFNLPRRVELDAWLRYVGELPNPAVPGYAELDVRLGWTPTAQVELAIAGQDLLHDHHPEFGAPTEFREEFQRSIRALVTIRRK